eukprot:365447-Chlamydomonas_euryale.AAC.28
MAQYLEVWEQPGPGSRSTAIAAAVAAAAVSRALGRRTLPVVAVTVTIMVTLAVFASVLAPVPVPVPVPIPVTFTVPVTATFPVPVTAIFPVTVTATFPVTVTASPTLPRPLLTAVAAVPTVAACLRRQSRCRTSRRRLSRRCPPRQLAWLAKVAAAHALSDVAGVQLHTAVLCAVWNVWGCELCERLWSNITAVDALGALTRLQLHAAVYTALPSEQMDKQTK